MGIDGGRERFQERTNVSRETMADLDEYHALIQKWNPAINLVSKATLPVIWERHFLDSAQILPLANINSGHWVDVGSGGGFPALVVAVLAKGSPKLHFTLVESDQRKAVFLRTVAQQLSLPVTVLSKRIEDLDPLEADILTARAMAQLSTLLELASVHLKPEGRALFPKGAKFRAEVDEALDLWAFQSDEYPSITDGQAVILSLGEIRRV